MFHELWVGMNVESPIKHVWWGWLQKQLIKSLLFRLDPGVIHTQTRIYQAQLSRLGYDVGYLPIFANIPEVSPVMVGTAQVYNSVVADKRLSLVVFGTIHPGAPVREFAGEVASYAKNRKKNVTLTMIGRCGNEQAYWYTVFKSAGIPVELLGEQSPERISEVLREASWGISTTPSALVEKSGTVAAMREHGLPVLCIAKPWNVRNFLDFKQTPGIIEYQAGFLEAVFSCKKNNSGSILRITEVAKLLEGSLNTKSSELSFIAI